MNSPSRKTRLPVLPSARATYRHGDLRRALLEAGVDLAREGGPDSVVLREATRRVGVVPNAAYRHFASREDLLEAVRASALRSLAIAMEAELAAVARGRRVPSPSPQQGARDSLRAIGSAYLRFALADTGLFRTAFSVPAAVEGDSDAAKAGGSGRNPFQLLGDALDLMVAAAILPPQQRPGAEYLAWSAVHGLALLLIDGPLKGAGRKRAEELSQRLLDMVERGLQQD